MGIKITDLTALATAPNTADVIAIVDVSDTTQALSGTTKKITIADLGFLSSGDNITELTNNAGYITSSDFSNGGELAGANRDLGNTDAFALSFITDGVGRINIEAGGDVGIGTTTPTEKLEVIGGVRVDAFAANQLYVSTSERFIGSGYTSNPSGLSQTTLGISGRIFTTLSYSANDIALVTHSSGNVAIFTNYSSGQDVQLKTSAANDDVKIGHGATITLTSQGSTGNVGIGTTTPTQKLEVVGNTLISSSLSIGNESIFSQALAMPDAYKIIIGSTARLGSTGGTTYLDGGADNNILFRDGSNNEIGKFEVENLTTFSRPANGTTTTRDYNLNLTGAYWNGASSVQTNSTIKHVSEDVSGNANLLIQGNGVDSASFDDDSTAGNTRFLIYDVDNATLERVSVGTADSGGAGFKVLRIPN